MIFVRRRIYYICSICFGPKKPFLTNWNERQGHIHIISSVRQVSLKRPDIVKTKLGEDFIDLLPAVEGARSIIRAKSLVKLWSDSMALMLTIGLLCLFAITISHNSFWYANNSSYHRAASTRAEAGNGTTIPAALWRTEKPNEPVTNSSFFRFSHYSHFPRAFLFEAGVAVFYTVR